MSERRIYITEKGTFITNENNQTQNGYLAIFAENKKGQHGPQHVSDIIPEGKHIREIKKESHLSDTGLEQYQRVKDFAILSEEEYQELVVLHQHSGCMNVLLRWLGIQRKLEDTIIAHLRKKELNKS